jgi:TPR repeat protein
VLKLALLRLEGPPYAKWSQEQREAALLDAIAFAAQVGAIEAARGTCEALGSHASNARHAHTVELLGTYGETLLRQVGASGTGEAEAKLALLHKLSGNGDDARYWIERATAVNSDYMPALSQQEWISQVHRYATEYQRISQPENAQLYLEYAASSGDGLAAYKLGHMAALQEMPEKAEKWYRMAADLGYSNGGPDVKRI